MRVCRIENANLGQNLIDGVLQPFVDSSFTWARNNIDKILSDAEAQLTGVTPGSSSQNISIERLSVLKGRRIKDTPGLKMSVQSAVEELGAGASWLLSKVNTEKSIVFSCFSNARIDYSSKIHYQRFK